MTTWAIEKGIRVEVEAMGNGTITKITPVGAMVQLDQYQIEVEVQKTWLKPIATSATTGTEQASSHAPVPNTSPSTSNYSEAAKKIMGAMGITSDSGTSGALTQTATQVKPNPPVHESSRNIEQAIDYEARRTLESLRFGLVPSSHIEELTLGYDDLKQWVLSCLPEQRGIPRPGMHKVVGPFGTGKSHTISVIRHIAEQEGYISAKVEVDGQTISFAEPAKLLNTLLSSLQGKDYVTEYPMLGLFLRAMEHGESCDAFWNLNLSKYFFNMKSIGQLKSAEVLELFESQLEAVLTASDEYTVPEVEKQIYGERSRLRYLVDLRSPVSRNLALRKSDFVEALVSVSLLAGMAGFRGLVILIDEFEVESNQTRTKFDRIVQQIRMIGDYVSLQGVIKLPSAPIALYFGAVGDEHNAAENALNESIAASKGSVYKLGTWNQEQRMQLAFKMYKLYQKAYGLDHTFDRELPLSLDKRMSGDEDSGMIRRFIKWYMTLLDIKYGPPGKTKS